MLEVGGCPPLTVLPDGPGEAGYYAPLLEGMDGYRVLLGHALRSAPHFPRREPLVVNDQYPRL